MTPDDFESLFIELDTKQVDSRAGNASKMGAIEPRVKLAICIRVLCGEALKTMAQLFCVGIVSASDAVSMYLDYICDCDKLAFGNTAPSLDDLKARAFEFSRRSTYPNVFQHCVEAIDGILIRIQCPRNEMDQRNFFSGHKLDYGLNLQASCDANCRFVNASLCCPGSANDIMAYNASYLPNRYAAYPPPYFVAGDSAYPDEDFMLTPSSAGSTLKAHDVYNCFLSQLRITIERSFGILNTVFAILQKPLKYDVAKCVKVCELQSSFPLFVSSCFEVVQVCLRLHNWRIDRGCQKVRQSKNLCYASSTDPYNLILNDERYLSAPHVSNRHV
jgi:hypothetical protein